MYICTLFLVAQKPRLGVPRAPARTQITGPKYDCGLLGDNNAMMEEFFSCRPIA